MCNNCRGRAILTLCVLAGLLLTTVTIKAVEIRNKWGVYWDDAIAPQGYAECRIKEADDAKLMEQVIVERARDHSVVLSDTVDTGVRGATEISSGLYVGNPWKIAVETDLFEPERFVVKDCSHWLVYDGLCEGQTEPQINKVCLKPVGDGVLIAVDADCCWAREEFTGTAALRLYLPLILKERS